MIFLIMFFSSVSFAQDDITAQRQYYIIHKVKHTISENIPEDFVGGGEPGGIVPTSPVPLPVTSPVYADGTYGNYGGYGSYGDPYGNSPEAILDTVLKIWNIVEKNRPVVTIESATYATAMPQASKNNWMSIGGWQDERNFIYTTDMINGFGMRTVHVSYQVKVVYGGNVKGKGLYIAAARIVPISVTALWGYNVNVSVSAPIVFNVRTPENPIAAIQLNVIYDVKTIVSEDITTDTYQVQGDGKIVDTKKGRTILPAVLK